MDLHPQRVDRRLRLFERGIAIQPRDRFHEVRRAAMRRHVPHQPLPDIHVVRIVESGRHDSDDRMRGVVDQQLPADDRRVGTVAGAPQAMADDRDRFVRHKQRRRREAGPELWRDAQDLEQIGAGFNRVHPDRVESGIGDVGARPPPCRRVGEHRQPALVHEVHRRDRVVAQRLCAVGIPDRHQAIRRHVW
jgi:hypothetical protein